MNITVYSPHNAIPSMRECLTRIVGVSCCFGLGLTGVVTGTHHYIASPLSQGIFWICLVLCVTFGTLLLRWIIIWKWTNELGLYGMVTEGKILALWEENARYYVKYAFNLAHYGQDPDDVAAHQRVQASMFSEMRIGDAVRIRFLPDNPNVSRMETNLWKWEY